MSLSDEDFQKRVEAQSRHEIAEKRTKLAEKLFVQRHCVGMGTEGYKSAARASIESARIFYDIIEGMVDEDERNI